MNKCITPTGFNKQCIPLAAPFVCIGNSLSLAMNGSGPPTDHNVLPATERIDKLKEEDIIMVGTDRGVTAPSSPTENTTTTTTPTTTTMKTDILSDSQLTIFKVGPDNNVEKVEDMTAFDNWEEDETKFKYVILHKLPNGEVVNLENLKTYSLADIGMRIVVIRENVACFNLAS